MIEPTDGYEPCMRPVDWALRYAAAGLSVLPIACDGTKQPPAGQAWKHLQERIAGDDEIRRMFAGDVGIAVINGKVSGNLETLDIDDPALVEPFEAAVREVAPDLLDRLPTIATPRNGGGGRHYRYRIEGVVAGNTKLAQSELRPQFKDGKPDIDPKTGKQRLAPETLIETRGEGGYIVDYGRIEVASEDLGVEQALLIALREFRDLALAGWPVGTIQGETKTPGQVWVDAGYMTPVVYSFCREAGNRFQPAVGRGAGQQRSQWYNRPKSTGAIVKHIGEGFHLSWIRTEKLHLAEVDADHWKTWVHQRLSTPLDANGAMTLFQTTPQEHLALVKHLTAERKTEEFVAGKGVVVKWERLRRQNHWLDALYNACAAGHYVGVRLVDDHRPQRLPPNERPTARELARRIHSP